MFENIPRILPHELYYGWIARVYQYHPYGLMNFIEAMIGGTSIAPYQLKPLKQEYSKLISMDEIIDEHSLARLFKFQGRGLTPPSLEGIRF